MNLKLSRSMWKCPAAFLPIIVRRGDIDPDAVSQRFLWMPNAVN